MERPGPGIRPAILQNRLSTPEPESSEEAAVSETTTCHVNTVQNVNSKVGSISVNSLRDLVKVFHAGQVSECLHEWEMLTSDPEILQIVNGDTIAFESEPPEKTSARKCNVSSETKLRLDAEVQGMLNKKIITRTSH